MISSMNELNSMIRKGVVFLDVPNNGALMESPLWRALADNGLRPRKAKDEETRVVIEIDCPFDSRHTRDGSLTLFPSGAAVFRCFHNSCSHRTVHDLLRKLNISLPRRRNVPTFQRSNPLTSQPADALSLEVADLVSVKPERVEWVVEGILPARGRTLLMGMPGAGKTTLAVEMTSALASGGVFLGRRLKPARVLWLSFEHTAANLRAKMDALSPTPEGMVFCVMHPIPPLDDTTFDRYAEAIGGAQVSVVVADTLLDFLSPTSADDTAVMRERMQMLIELSERTGAAFLGISHPRKDAAGESVYSLANSFIITAKADVVLMLASAPPSPDGSGGRARLTAVKNRHAVPKAIKLQKSNGRFLVLSEADNV